MLDLHDKIAAAVSAIRSRWNQSANTGIILGTGLGGFSGRIESAVEIPYAEIPHFPESTVESHAGRLVCGTLDGKNVLVMDGRFHFYEGYSMREITFPVRVMRAMGCEVLVLSNACGGMNPQYDLGDIVIIEDHINLMGGNPLIGVNDDRLGPRFPDMSQPYDKRLIEAAKKCALENKIQAHTGVYVAIAGPNLETRAEYRFLRGIGADVVGMSTVPEVLVGIHAGMRCFGLSVVTDICLPDALEPADVNTIIAVAGASQPALTTLIRAVVAAG